MLRCSLCDYSDAYILVKGPATNNTDKKVISKNCASFTNCISKVNNTQIDNAEYIDIVMQNFKSKITGKTGNGRRIYNVEIMVPLKYLSNFWRTLELPLINWEVEFILTWSAGCVIIYTDVANQVPTFTIT